MTARYSRMVLNVFGKITSSVLSRYSFSHRYFHFFILSTIWKRPKFKDPAFREAISGFREETTFTLFSKGSVSRPPVVKQKIISHFFLTRTAISRYASWSAVG